LTVLGAEGADPAPTKLMYVTDPDGTRIELMENVPDLSTMSAATANGLAAHIGTSG
jgi:lactoylglutathione lyase